MDHAESKTIKKKCPWQDVDRVHNRMDELFVELMAHPGFGEMHMSVKILKHGKKEVILSCGRQYRFVLQPVSPPKEKEKGETTVH